MQRFWNKVNILKEEDCWIWLAGGRGVGYGSFKYQGKTIDAHRFSWIITFGNIPKGLCVLHKCDNRKCVNPKHLFLGTLKESVADMVAKGRQHSTPHGNSNKYDAGCRCNLCREARMQHQREYRASLSNEDYFRITKRKRRSHSSEEERLPFKQEVGVS